MVLTEYAEVNEETLLLICSCEDCYIQGAFQDWLTG